MELEGEGELKLTMHSLNGKNNVIHTSFCSFFVDLLMDEFFSIWKKMCHGH